MNITIVGHGLEITPPLREFAEEKLSKITKHFDRIISIHVILSIEKNEHIAEATTNYAKADLHTKAIEVDTYAAIDVLVDKLHRQIVKHKEKMQTHRE